MQSSNSPLYDVCIIGAGVVGLNIAREISRYKLRICVLEKEEDAGARLYQSQQRDCTRRILRRARHVESRTVRQRQRACMKHSNRSCISATVALVRLYLLLAEEEIPALLQLQSYGQKNGVQGAEHPQFSLKFYGENPT